MGTIVLAGTTVLVILGFGNHTWWLVAVAVLCLYVRYGRTGVSQPGGVGQAGQPATYQAYRERRDRQARWERRYRRERPFETRRQDRGKSG